MKANLGNWTRGVRASIGVVFIILFLTDVVNGTLGYMLVGLASLLLITSAIAFCPAASICPISRLMKLFGLE